MERDWVEEREAGLCCQLPTARSSSLQVRDGWTEREGEERGGGGLRERERESERERGDERG